ncbi:MAG: hypothetical protein SVN78_08455, partial [Deferribacterota bacterium]|nr:hypothetical protein [Deferribacterota bacterium]
GVVTNGIYDMWWHGGLRPAPYYHNQIGILTEAARVNIASPVFIDFDELIGRRGIPSTQERYINFTDVWEGGEWHSRDIAKYEEETLRSIIEVSVKYRKDFINRFYDRNVDAIEKGQTEPPYGYIFNIDRNDRSKLLWLMEVLNFQGIELYITKDTINIGDDIFPANSFIVLSSQPQRPNVLALLSKQEYPPRFVYPDGPPEPPYDIVSWNLIQQMSLEAKQLGQPLPEYIEENLIKIKPSSNLNLLLNNKDNLKNRRINFLNKLNDNGIDLTGKVVGHASEGGGYIFSPANDNYAVVINRLREKGYNDIYFTAYRVRYEDKVFPVNTCVVSYSKELHNNLESLAKELSINFYAISGIDQLTLKKASKKKVALYESYNENYPTGWLQFVLDAFEFKYSIVHNKDIKEGNLNSKYDLILFGSESYEDIMNGRDADRYLDEYAGGIGKEGLNNVKDFLINGGKLLLIDEASDLAIKGLKVPVKNILDNVSESEFYCPGSILNMHIEDLNNNLFAGYSNENIFAYFKFSPTFELLDDKNIDVLATWPQNPDDILASGWILGEDLISGKSAILDVKYGEGDIIMTAFDAVHRGQPHVTFKLLFNAILNKIK